VFEVNYNAIWIVDPVVDHTLCFVVVVWFGDHVYIIEKQEAMWLQPSPELLSTTTETKTMV